MRVLSVSAWVLSVSPPSGLRAAHLANKELSVVRRCECGRLFVFYCGRVIKSRLVQSAAGAACRWRGWMNLLKKVDVVRRDLKSWPDLTPLVVWWNHTHSPPTPAIMSAARIKTKENGWMDGWK